METRPSSEGANFLTVDRLHQMVRIAEDMVDERATAVPTRFQLVFCAQSCARRRQVGYLSELDKKFRKLWHWEVLGVASLAWESGGGQEEDERR
ncbi:hypothetical protein E2C01_018788 [Portunus trituberculatus]|uniref:Uncharacterized protein n=1 Tax=Portunus trituberculatus TaxID=210409 RepID=A0A5B7DXB7_PORTR|nr:hypothetical protein [Portunus trituberculatus]